MRYVPKALLSVFVGLVLWVISSLLLTFALGALVYYVEPFGVVLAWIENSESFGHLVPIVFRAMSCILPAYVIMKICQGDDKQSKVSMVTMYGVLIILQIWGVFAGEGSMWWLVQGAIGQAAVLVAPVVTGKR